VNIYSADQIKAWDAYTILHEPIASIDLMERAAQKCVDWLLANGFQNKSFKIFCGKGNNGGDGLAIARLLFQNDIPVEVYILEFGKIGSNDFQANLQRLHELPVTIHFIQSPEHFPNLLVNDIIIDALFGSGLNKPLEGLTKQLVEYLNATSNKIISVDLPSGMFVDSSSKNNQVIKADATLSFQTFKKAFLVAENETYTGKVHVLDVGLHPGFLKKQISNTQFLEREDVIKIFQPRKSFSHKGNFGHALLVGGSYGKIGAIVLSVSACLRGGVGLATAYIPRCGYSILQTSLPEAMVMTDPDESMITKVAEELEKYSVIGIGPGMGTNKQTREAIFNLIKTYSKPVVVDADGLNSLALQPEYIQTLPPHSILTPHPKEFERLFGTCENDFERITRTKEKAKEHNIIIVLKGHYTFIALPDGSSYFNSTGNAGMAKGGSGDVLTGIITALCAQNYKPGEAALLGVYLHGLAGDLAAAALSKEAMTARDIITFLSQAFLEIEKDKTSNGNDKG
jgi:NAD(P)H-hydrate epimerase